MDTEFVQFDCIVVGSDGFGQTQKRIYPTIEQTWRMKAFDAYFSSVGGSDKAYLIARIIDDSALLIKRNRQLRYPLVPGSVRGCYDDLLFHAFVSW